jgi:hypothetical protein
VSLESRLLVLGVVIFGVLGDIAELTSLLDAGGNLAPSGRGQALIFRSEVGKAFRREDDILGHRDQTCVLVKRGTRETRGGEA